MTTTPVIGHEEILDRFATWLKRDRLASTWLLAGPSGVGKRVVANWLAQCLLCESTPRDELQACQQCSACRQVEAGTHPDLLTVERPGDKNEIPVELLIGPRERRMREGFCHDIALRPFRGGRRIAIIDDADYLNEEGANCLLKTLEEPPPAAMIFLISDSEHRQLITIRSRSQIVRFQTLTADQIQDILVDRHLLQEGSPDPRALALASGGSLQMALQLADPETMEFRQAWLERLGSLDPGRDEFDEKIQAFAGAVSQKGSVKRDRLRLVVELATQFYRNAMLSLCGEETVSDPIMRSGVEAAVENWNGGPDVAARCVERCQRVRKEIAANANQALMVECFLSDLGRIVRDEVPA